MRALDIRPVVRNVILGARNAIEWIPVRAEIAIDVEIKTGTSGGIRTTNFVSDVHAQIYPTRNLLRSQLDIDDAVVGQGQVPDQVRPRQIGAIQGQVLTLPVSVIGNAQNIIVEKRARPVQAIVKISRGDAKLLSEIVVYPAHPLVVIRTCVRRKK